MLAVGVWDQWDVRTLRRAEPVSDPPATGRAIVLLPDTDPDPANLLNLRIATFGLCSDKDLGVAVLRMSDGTVRFGTATIRDSGETLAESFGAHHLVVDGTLVHELNDRGRVERSWRAEPAAAEAPPEAARIPDLDIE